MAASALDKLKKYKSLFSTTLSTGIGTGTSDTITPATVTGLPTDTGITLTIDRVDSSGTATPSKMERISGVISGGNLIDYVRGVDSTTEQAHTAGAVVEMVWNAADNNNIVDWGLVQHGQDGVHTSALVTSLKASGSDINTGTSDTTIVTPKAIADSKLSDYIRGDGWINANETWTYASATTINVPSGAASRYQKGDKIKLTQTTVKYFYIIGVTDTVLTVTGGSDYTVANAAISANYYSHQENPLGFPNEFTWAPTYSASGSMTFQSVTTYGAKFNIKGNIVQCWLSCGGTTGGTASNELWVTLPVTSYADTRWSACVVKDGDGTSILGWAICYAGSTNTRVSLSKGNSANYTLGASAGCRAFFNYMLP